MKTKALKILQIRIHSNITEEENFYNFQFSKREKIPLRMFLESLRKARKETEKFLAKRKKNSLPPAVLLKIERIDNLDWSTIESIRRELSILDSLPSFAYIEAGGLKEYYLASRAEKIIVPPSASLDLLGLSAEVFFLHKGLKNLGISPEFLKTGDYKTFADTFTRNSISKSHQEMLESILHDYMNEITQKIQKTRDFSDTSFSELIDQAPFTAEESLRKGLVDYLLYEEELKNFFQKNSDFFPNKNSHSNSDSSQKLNLEDSVEDSKQKRQKKEEKEEKKVILFPLSTYRDKKKWNPFQKSAKIALVYSTGQIVDDKQSKLQSQSISSHSLRRLIRKLRNSRKIQAIVLRVNSPGGSALGSDILWHEIKRAKEKKPVVVSMGPMAASGGYYISVAGSHVFAEPQTLTGSIGVVMGKFVLEKLFKKLGIHSDSVSLGKHAGIYSMTRSFQKEEKDLLEKQIHSFYYRQFLEKVASCRNKKLDEIESLAQGRVWTGKSAQSHGLVDELGGLLQALDKAKELAEIPNSTVIQYKIFPKKRWKLPSLLSLQGNQNKNHFPFWLVEIIQNFKSFSLFDSKSPLYLLPFVLRIRS